MEITQLPSDYQQFIFLSRYARWREEDGRREHWNETVSRYISFFNSYIEQNHGYEIPTLDLADVKYSILNLHALPSMRALMTAGPALERCHVSAYNCSYFPVSDSRGFDEAMYILMCGTGDGFSVERQLVSNLPQIPDTLEKIDYTIMVADSKMGWASAFRDLIHCLFRGEVPSWDVSRVRPSGARLRTTGGRASGPEPLVRLFEFTVRMFDNAKGRKLTSSECHSLMCMIGEVVVVGGVRRAALISLSNLSDDRMRDAKSGQWWEQNPHFALANNSVAYTEKPDALRWMREWTALVESKSGERGIFNRQAAQQQASRWGRRPADAIYGINPCGEIILLPYEFCNLTEVVVRPEDDLETLERKVRVAAIMGTWQSCLTKFRYIRRRWAVNCEQERLLGVSLTGIMDNVLTNGSCKGYNVSVVFETLRDVARKTNKEWAEKLGINESAAITCVKPSGTVSQLALCGSGIHAWYAPQYVRRVRLDSKDPMVEFMRDAGFPCEPDVTKPDDMMVFSFPIEAPEGAVCEDDRSAVEKLEHWRLVREHWCEHNPSVTVQVKDEEWPGVGGWVYDNWDSASGLTFLPRTDHTYRQAPYEAVSKETWEEMRARMPENVDWSKLAEYEQDDAHLADGRELACTAGVCEI